MAQASRVPICFIGSGRFHLLTSRSYLYAFVTSARARTIPHFTLAGHDTMSHALHDTIDVHNPALTQVCHSRVTLLSQV
jgi:hypothetical protein